jgi:hypothetical protein
MNDLSPVVVLYDTVRTQADSVTTCMESVRKVYIRKMYVFHNVTSPCVRVHFLLFFFFEQPEIISTKILLSGQQHQTLDIFVIS